MPKLRRSPQNGYDQRIFVRGDKTVDYGRVMEVMGLLASAGFTHIGLVTDVAKPKPDETLDGSGRSARRVPPRRGAARGPGRCRCCFMRR